MILADTSAWVEFIRGTGSAVDARMNDLIADEGPLVTTEPVVMEVLAGARSPKDERDLRRLLNRFPLQGFEVVADFEGAVRIYRDCRAAGITPRGLIDCLIANVAWRTGSTLLVCDADLVRIAGVMSIPCDVASSPA